MLFLQVSHTSRKANPMCWTEPTAVEIILSHCQTIDEACTVTDAPELGRYVVRVTPSAPRYRAALARMAWDNAPAGILVVVSRLQPTRGRLWCWWNRFCFRHQLSQQSSGCPECFSEARQDW